MITDAANAPSSSSRRAAERAAGRTSPLPRTRALLPALALAVACTGTAVAQTTRSVCQNVGATSNEPFGDQPGRNLVVAEYSCRVTEGPMSGSVMSGIGYWDARGGNWFLVAGSGMSRRPDAFVVFQQIEGRLDVTMKDGKPAGWTSSGRARYQTASGAVSSLAGKDFRWRSAATGPNMFTLESELE